MNATIRKWSFGAEVRNRGNIIYHIIYAGSNAAVGQQSVRRLGFCKRKRFLGKDALKGGGTGLGGEDGNLPQILLLGALLYVLCVCVQGQAGSIGHNTTHPTPAGFHVRQRTRLSHVPR